MPLFTQLVIIVAAFLGGVLAVLVDKWRRK
jgi:hypothetical protein